MAAGTSSFRRDALKVLNGTVLAQAVPILAMLVLTRLVSPGEMGLYGTWLGIVYIVATVITLRLEVQILIAKTPEQVEALRRCALLFTAIGAALSVVLALAFDSRIAANIGGWTPLAGVALGAGAAAMALSQVWRSLAIALADFQTLNLLRLLAASGAALLQIIAAAIWANGNALLIAFAAGTALAVAYIAARLNRSAAARSDGSQGVAPARMSWADALRITRPQMRTPLLALPSDVINVFSQYLPLMLVGARFGPEVAGFLALAFRTFDAPISVVGASVMDVYKQRAGDEFKRTGQCRTAFKEGARMLGALAIAPTLALAFFGPGLFAFVYGEAWREAGAIVQILSPMIFLRFLASPLGYTLYIGQRAHWMLAWQIALVLTTAACFLIPAEASRAMISYSAGYFSLYLAFLWLNYMAARGHDHRSGSPDPLAHARGPE